MLPPPAGPGLDPFQARRDVKATVADLLIRRLREWGVRRVYGGQLKVMGS